MLKIMLQLKYIIINSYVPTLKQNRNIHCFFIDINIKLHFKIKLKYKNKMNICDHVACDH